MSPPGETTTGRDLCENGTIALSRQQEKIGWKPLISDRFRLPRHPNRARADLAPPFGLQLRQVVVEYSHIGPELRRQPPQGRPPPGRDVRRFQMRPQCRREADTLLRVEGPVRRFPVRPAQERGRERQERARSVERRVGAEQESSAV